MEDLELGLFTTRLSKKKIEEIEKFVNILKKEFDNIRISYHKVKISKLKREKPKIISSSTKEKANYILITKGSRDILSFYKLSKSGGGGGYLFNENLSEKDYSKIKGLLHSHKVAFTLNKNLELMNKTLPMQILRYIIPPVLLLAGVFAIWLGYRTIVYGGPSWRDPLYNNIMGFVYLVLGVYVLYSFRSFVLPKSITQKIFRMKKSKKKKE